MSGTVEQAMGESRKTRKARGEVWCSDESLVVRAIGAMTAPKCPGCGFSLEGLEVARCPECGRTIRAVVRSTNLMSSQEVSMVVLSSVLLVYPATLLSTWIIGKNWLLADGTALLGPFDFSGLSLLAIGAFVTRAAISRRASRFAVVGRRMCPSDYLAMCSAALSVFAILLLLVVLIKIGQAA